MARNRFIAELGQSRAAAPVRNLKRLVRWRIVQPLRRTAGRWKSQKSGLHADPCKIYWISPSVLEDTIFGPDDVPNPAMVSGMVKGGDWDKKTLPVPFIPVVRGARDRYVAGMAWPETDYYQEQAKALSEGLRPHGCGNKKELDAYFEGFDRLYESIKRDGYKPQASLRGPEYAGSGAAENEITVHIDRDGHYLFCDGRHRLAIVLALGLDRIPVKVCIRHAQWQEFVNLILDFAANHDGKVYQALTHTDLQDIPFCHGHERFDIIKGHLPEGGKTLLDIGSNWGYFCHRFEELGYNCTAVEADPETASFLKRLRTAQARDFEILNESILDYPATGQYSVVLALNIFHHFLKYENRYDALRSLLARLKMDTMFFEPHQTSEVQMIGAYRNFPPDEFVQFILDNSCLKHSKLIGHADDRRPIYKLWA
jgi:hypothetical protein